MIEAVLPKHSGPPPHCHPWDETYYVIEGEIRFVIAGQEHIVGRGDFIYAPGGTVHSFKGMSDSQAKMLIFDAPAHSEAFFQVIDKEIREIPHDLGKMPSIGEQHQVQFMTS
ncbi:cupin domain-containing protein [Noviherbaspirillum malthae]|uniref:cupin domain-containing protein n=1 Tax=Noviherbaspirillum malthae TaxID=1260987 RepID=UPI00188E7F8A|nr:cupin domain-containing protein [Noviherbaspirillum malthae]